MRALGSIVVIVVRTASDRRDEASMCVESAFDRMRALEVLHVRQRGVASRIQRTYAQQIAAARLHEFGGRQA